MALVALGLKLILMIFIAIFGVMSCVFACLNEMLCGSAP